MLKRSVRIAGHNTSITLEPEFWVELTRLAGEQGLSINQLITRVDQGRQGNLSSALRVFVLNSVKGAGV